MGLHWTVQTRKDLVPTGRDDRQTVSAPGYRALVRPDTGQVMSIVSTTYRVAENEWVVRALERLCGRPGEREPVIAVAGYGRDGERTVFAGRVAESRDRAVRLLAYNTHGGEGAVRFQLVEVGRQERATFVLDSAHAAFSIPHVGDVEDRHPHPLTDHRDEAKSCPGPSGPGQDFRPPPVPGLTWGLSACGPRP